jgi:predicted DNA-binding transcriptional regulator YafY
MARVERHAEIVRQWRLLVHLESSSRGQTLAQLREAAGGEVSERTIRRDLDALTQAGFPIEHERRDQKTWFRLNREAFRGITTAGFTLPELCALYFSRSLLRTLGGTPFHDSLDSAFDKLADALPPALWAFVDRLPQALAAKGHLGRSAGTPEGADVVRTLVSATIDRRRLDMRYHSFSSGRVKDYVVEPHRLAWAAGALYLFAFVPEYGEMRTFAVARIVSAAVRAEAITTEAPAAGEVFPQSLGAFSSAPERIAIDFTPDAARYIREREWHPSQTLVDRADGAVTLHLHVSVDPALRAWVLGFGPEARVLAPVRLAEDVRRAAEATAAAYTDGEPKMASRGRSR